MKHAASQGRAFVFVLDAEVIAPRKHVDQRHLAKAEQQSGEKSAKE